MSKTEMPYWLLGELGKWSAQIGIKSVFTMKAIVLASAKTYELMSERQKLKPIESAPKDREILLGMENGKFWATGQWWQDHESWSYPFNVEGGKPTHWTELPGESE